MAKGGDDEGSLEVGGQVSLELNQQAVGGEGSLELGVSKSMVVTNSRIVANDSYWRLVASSGIVANGLNR